MYPRFLSPRLYRIETFSSSYLERNLERVSDESSKRADSDSHPENWTDSDPPPPNTSPPKGRSVRNFTIFIMQLKNLDPLDTLDTLSEGRRQTLQTNIYLLCYRKKRIVKVDYLLEIAIIHQLVR